MKKVMSFLLSISSILLLILIFVPVIISWIIEPSVATLILFAIALVLMLIFAIWLCIVMVYYIAHATKSQQFNAKQKAIWSTLFVVLSLFVFPVYWFLYMRKE